MLPLKPAIERTTSTRQLRRPGGRSLPSIGNSLYVPHRARRIFVSTDFTPTSVLHLTGTHLAQQTALIGRSCPTGPNRTIPSSRLVTGLLCLNERCNHRTSSLLAGSAPFPYILPHIALTHYERNVRGIHRSLPPPFADIGQHDPHFDS